LANSDLYVVRNAWSVDAKRADALTYRNVWIVEIQVPIVIVIHFPDRTAVHLKDFSLIPKEWCWFVNCVVEASEAIPRRGAR